MKAKIEIRRGRTLLLPGTWESGDPFTVDSSLACQMVRVDVQIDLTVTKTSERGFEIYASNVDTAAFAPGVYDAFLTRTDAGYFLNGDDFVDGLEPFQIEVI